MIDDPLVLAILRANAARSPGLRFGGKRWSGRHSDKTRAQMCVSQKARRAREMDARFKAGEPMRAFSRRRFALRFWL